jgi:hypothetical protein
MAAIVNCVANKRWPTKIHVECDKEQIQLGAGNLETTMTLKFHAIFPGPGVKNWTVSDSSNASLDKIFGPFRFLALPNKYLRAEALSLPNI